MSSNLYIKNMVCDRCIKVVGELLSSMNIGINDIELGKINLKSELTFHQKEILINQLEKEGFEIVDDKRSVLINKIKTLIIEIIYNKKEKPTNTKISDFIVSEIGKDYSYLSALFSSIEGLTIEKYMIQQKIERVKELLVYDELSLSQISYDLDYSSVQHLSNQFKQITGLTPSYYKKMGESKRKGLDKI